MLSSTLRGVYIFHQSIILIIFEEEMLIRTHPTAKFHFKTYVKIMINYAVIFKRIAHRDNTCH